MSTPSCPATRWVSTWPRSWGVCALRNGQPGRQRARPRRAGLGRATDERGPARRASRSHRAASARARSALASAPRRRRSCVTRETRHDLTARLEANEWRGAVEPRLVIRSLHSLATRTRPPPGRRAMPTMPRMVGRRLGAPTRRPTPGSGRARRAPTRTVVDRRGEGAMGVLGDLMTTGEPLLVLCADVSRRAALIERELGAGAFRARAMGALVGGLRPGASSGRAPADCAGAVATTRTRRRTRRC